MASDETYTERCMREQREERRDYFQLQQIRYLDVKFIFLVLKDKTHDETSLKGTLPDSIVFDGTEVELQSEDSTARCCDFEQEGPLADSLCLRCGQGKS